MINWRIRAAARFHDVLHGFQVGQVTRTTSLKSKLLHQLVVMREEVLYKVFLDLQKAYETLDQYRCMDILVGYGVDLRMERILKDYWDHLPIVARAGR